MEPDLPGGVVQEQVEVPDEGEVVAAGWEEHVPALDPVEIACALIVEQRFLTR